MQTFYYFSSWFSLSERSKIPFQLSNIINVIYKSAAVLCKWTGDQNRHYLLNFHCFLTTQFWSYTMEISQLKPLWFGCLHLSFNVFLKSPCQFYSLALKHKVVIYLQITTLCTNSSSSTHPQDTTTCYPIPFFLLNNLFAAISPSFKLICRNSCLKYVGHFVTSLYNSAEGLMDETELTIASVEGSAAFLINCSRGMHTNVPAMN